MRLATNLIQVFRNTWLFWALFIALGFGFGFRGRGFDTVRLNFVAGLAFALLLALWVAQDARQRRRVSAYDLPALVFLLWPILVPVYLAQTRGWRAFLTLVGFIGLVCTASLMGLAIGSCCR